MKNPKYIALLLLAGCIGQDIEFDEVQPVVRITNPVQSIQVNTNYQFEYAFLDNTGEPVTADDIIWSTSDMAVLTIDNSGLATALSLGTATIDISVSYQTATDTLMADTSVTVQVTAEPTMAASSERTGSMSPSSGYGLQGNFRLYEDGENLILEFDDTYNFNGAPGPYLYLTNNASSLPGASDYEIGVVTVQTGAHSYTIPMSAVELNDYSVVYFYCEPFRIRLGFGVFDN